MPDTTNATLVAPAAAAPAAPAGSGPHATAMTAPAAGARSGASGRPGLHRLRHHGWYRLITPAAVAATALALVAGLSRSGENAVDPLLQILRTLPLFGLIPVFIVWFGIGELPKVILIALGTRSEEHTS